MIRSDRRSQAVASFEPLESRQLLAGNFVFESYHPEGFASDTINEFVPVTNPNNEVVRVKLTARYEFSLPEDNLPDGSPLLETVIGEFDVPANTRTGFTTSDASNPTPGRFNAAGVREGIPYALVIESTLPVSATLAHYDFGTAVGEAFTSRLASEWTFADAFKDTATTSDFLLFFNPSAVTILVTTTIFAQPAAGETAPTVITLTQELLARRRGGYDLNNLRNPDGSVLTIPDGSFGLRTQAANASNPTSSIGFVAAQSHYLRSQDRGYGTLGSEGGGATDGFVGSVGFDSNFYNTNGQGPGNPTQFQADTFISVLNTESVGAIVTFQYVPENRDFNPIVFTRAVAAGSQARFSLRDLRATVVDIPDAALEGALLYTSNVEVTVAVAVYQGMDATGVAAESRTSDTWDFGEGFTAKDRRGTGVQEDLYIYNPTAGNANVTVTFFFLDGTTASIARTIGAGLVENVVVHDLPEVFNKTIASDPNAQIVYYGIRVSTGTGGTKILAEMEHWDAAVGGGFTSFGQPRGVTTPLDINGGIQG